MVLAVLDTNILVSGSTASQGPIADIINGFLTEVFRVFLSHEILDELERALATRYYTRRLTPDRIAAYLDLVRSVARIVPITERVEGVASHRQDDLILATAVSAGVAYIVTGDRGLQRVGMVSRRERRRPAGVSRHSRTRQSIVERTAAPTVGGAQ